MSKQTRYLLTVDSATGAAVKLERLGEAGDLTEVPLSSLSVAPVGVPGAAPMVGGLMMMPMAVPQMPAMVPILVPAYIYMYAPMAPMPVAGFAPPVGPGASPGLAGPGAPGGPGVYSTLADARAAATQPQGPGGPGSATTTATATQGPGGPACSREPWHPGTGWTGGGPWRWRGGLAVGWARGPDRRRPEAPVASLLDDRSYRPERGAAHPRVVRWRDRLRAQLSAPQRGPGRVVWGRG